MIKQELESKKKEISLLNQSLNEKESTIRNISIVHTQFKQQLEIIKEELMLNQNEKDTLSKKLSNIEKVDSKTAALQNENLREQNKKLLSTLIKLLNTNDGVK